MIIEVSTIDSPRFDFGVELLGNGGGFRLNGVEFLLHEGLLECRIQSSWDPENLTDEFAQKDIERGIHTYQHLRLHSPDFALKVGNAVVRYSLIDNYGMGCVELCRSEDGAIKWSVPPAIIFHDIPKLLNRLFASNFQMADARVGTMHSYSITFAGPQTLTITCDRGQLIFAGERSELEPHGLWKAFDSFAEFEDAVIRYLDLDENAA